MLAQMLIQLPEKLKSLDQPSRYKIVYGGRGSAKSWTVATKLVLRSASQPTRIMCAREFQSSMQDSVYQLLSDKIFALGLQDNFRILRDRIINTDTDSIFSFVGLRNDPNKVRSAEGYDIAWIEEAQSVTQQSLNTLIPTMRSEGSEIWATYNPMNDDDPIHKLALDPPPNSIVVQMNWRDNPWFPSVLEDERQYLKSRDMDLYLHVWEGQTYNRSEAQIFWDKVIQQDFEPLTTWSGPYYGLDWGFANDPMRLVRCWIGDQNLYIEKEVHGLRVDINDIPKTLTHETHGDPFCHKYVIRADNSRPETISYCQQHGMPGVVACKKGAGSVDDGISFIRSFKNIIIHSRCKHTFEEARLYSYKTDRLTGDVLPQPVDAYNHSWDAVRYALEPLIPSGQPGRLIVR